MTKERQKAIDKIADEISIFQLKHGGKKPVRVYMSTALYQLIANQKWQADLKNKVHGIEVKCYASLELEFSICEVVTEYEMFAK